MCCKDVLVDSEQVWMLGVAQQHVPIIIEADQSSFQPCSSEHEQMVKLVRRTRTSEEVVSGGGGGVSG